MLQNFAIFQKENAKHIQELSKNTTITIGLVQAQGLDIKRITTRQKAMGKRLDTMDQRLGTLEQDMGEVKGLVAQILERLPNSR